MKNSSVKVQLNYNIGKCMYRHPSKRIDRWEINTH